MIRDTKESEEDGILNIDRMTCQPELQSKLEIKGLQTENDDLNSREKVSESLALDGIEREIKNDLYERDFLMKTDDEGEALDASLVFMSNVDDFDALIRL
ncbi:hypothetical protein Tco_0434649 [Tanacetum coccineum]